MRATLIKNLSALMLILAFSASSFAIEPAANKTQALTLAAEKGDVASQVELGGLYWSGKGVDLRPLRNKPAVAVNRACGKLVADSPYGINFRPTIDQLHL